MIAAAFIIPVASTANKKSTVAVIPTLYISAPESAGNIHIAPVMVMVTGISRSSCMMMDRNLCQRIGMFFFAQLISGFIHGPAVSSPGTNQTTAHGKGYPGQYVAGFLPSTEI